MDSQNALNVLTTLIAKKEEELDALKVATTLLVDGFESDSTRIREEVEKEIAKQATDEFIDAGPGMPDEENAQL